MLDDILIGFDDARAVAALSALAELSAHTQILFFTHHQHLVELAVRTLDKGLFQVHSLGWSKKGAKRGEQKEQKGDITHFEPTNQ